MNNLDGSGFPAYIVRKHIDICFTCRSIYVHRKLDLRREESGLQGIAL